MVIGKKCLLAASFFSQAMENKGRKSLYFGGSFLASNVMVRLVLVQAFFKRFL